MTDADGLSNKEAIEKLEKYGYNEIKELFQISPFRILSGQIKNNFVIYLLVAAAVISFLVGKTATEYVIFVVITVVISVGFFQEYRAEKAIKALKQMIMPVCAVIREGMETEIPSREIVPEDIVVLRTGEKIPADCLILQEKELKVNESVLTGESKEIEKFAAKDEKVYKRENKIFMGTHIVNGKCIAKVLNTGMKTEFGKIAKMISAAEKELPLQKKVNQITKYMALAAVFFSVLTGIIMITKAGSFSYDVITGVLIVVIALSVSAFPEGFPVVLISTLASGARGMAKKNAIVNRMSIIETLGETTVICSDKTGTITTGEMTVKHVFTDDKIFDVTGAGYEADGDFLWENQITDAQKNIPLKMLLKSSVLCNDARIEKKGTDSEYNLRGTPTEGALLIMSAKAGIFREDLKFAREEEIPFSSERKMMSVLCREMGKHIVYSKGAPEILVKRCKSVQLGDKIMPLNKNEKEKILKFDKEFSSKKFRVIALAYKKTKSFKKDGLEKDLIFLGLAALDDPPREEVKSTLEICRGAGIKVKMITGDNKDTAIQIAKEIGLYGDVLTGDEMDGLSDRELSEIVDKIAIFSRVRPDHKIRIVRALKRNNEIVAMTGDGVNDAPALKEAHVGVAMGINGTDVSRESADLILKDDNFATIVSAIREGRTIFSNIQKFITYQLSCNYAELFIIFFGILLGLPLPLLALQILFMNLVTDNLPAITLGFNPPPSYIMERKARKKSAIMDMRLLRLLVIAGTTMGIATLGVFYFTLNVLNQDIMTARTTALMTLIFFEIANAFNFRSFRHTVFRSSPFANKYLVYASIASVFASFLIVYSPLNVAFETAPIGWFNMILGALLSLSVIIVFDLLKMKKRRE